MSTFHTSTQFTAQETFRGFVDSGIAKGLGIKSFNLGQHSWHDRCCYYDQIFDDHPLAKSLVTSVAGQLTAQGIFNVENDAIHDEPKGTAKDACDEVDSAFRRKLEAKIMYDLTVNIAKHGSVFLEVTKLPTWDIRTIPFQEAIEPSRQDDVGEIVEWKQVFNNQAAATWTTDTEQDTYIIPIHWNVSSRSWPYGTSLYAGLDSEFKTLQQLKLDIAEYMHNNAFPMEIYAIGDGEFMPQDADLAAVRSIVKVTQPGQKLITSYPINHMVGGTGDREVKGMDTVLAFEKEELIDGGGIPPISKIWNSTNASATAMLPWTLAIFVQPLQRIFAYSFEEDFYKPYLESLGYSRKLCPRLEFNPPNDNKMDDANYWFTLVRGGIIPAMYAAEELGFDTDHIIQLMDEEEKRIQEKQKIAQALMAQNPQANGQPQGQGKEQLSPTQQFVQRSDKLQASAALETDGEFDEYFIRKRKPQPHSHS